MHDILARYPNRIFIRPGQFFVTDKETVLSTLLGSCISVCLYDPVCRVMGMNHFMVSYGESDQVCHLDTGKHGFCAMESVLDGMTALGANPKHLQAKVFGGGSMFRPYAECGLNHCVGRANADFVQKELKRRNIRLIVFDVGGEQGRLIHFTFGDFSVYVKKVKSSANRRLVKKDQQFWNQLRQADAG